jgi:hypothetical protein
MLSHIPFWRATLALVLECYEDLVANFYVYMLIKSHTFILYHLRDHNFQS